MDKRKREALEAAGWRFGDAADFLGLTDDERQEVDLRVALCRAIRRLRQAQHVTQQQLAARLESSQSRVAKIEAGVAASLDLMFRAFFVLGGRLDELVQRRRKRRKQVSRS